MKKIILVVLSLIVFSSPSYGLNCTNCTIKNVGCSYKHQGAQTCNVLVEGAVAGSRPACHTVGKVGSLNRWVIDVTTDAGKAMQALAVAAQLADKAVVIYGLNQCQTWANTEEANFIYLGEINP